MWDEEEEEEEEDGCNGGGPGWEITHCLHKAGHSLSDVREALKLKTCL